MNSRQRLVASLTGGVPDRVAWAPMIDGYFMSSLDPSFLQENLGFTIEDYSLTSEHWAELRRRIVDFTRFIGADILERHAPGVTTHISDLVTEELLEDHKIRRRFITSVGEVTDVLSPGPESSAYPFVGVEYKLKTQDDLRVYQHIWENTQFAADAQSFLDEQAYIGEAGLPAVDGPQSAVQYLLGEEAGLANFYYLLQDYPQETNALIETIHARLLEAYQAIAHLPGQVVVAMEDLSSTTSSPAIFERYSWRHLNEYADILHAEGKIFLAHMCGRLKAMAPLIARSRLDGVESLTPPEIGDLTVETARQAWGDDFVIVGGLNAHVMLETDQAKVKDAVIAALRQAAPGKKFILSNSDAMPYGAKVETLRTIGQAVADYGGLPLAIA